MYNIICDPSDWPQNIILSLGATFIGLPNAVIHQNGWIAFIRPFVVLVRAAKFIYRHTAYRQNNIISPGANRPSRFL